MLFALQPWVVICTLMLFALMLGRTKPAWLLAMSLQLLQSVVRGTGPEDPGTGMSVTVLAQSYLADVGTRIIDAQPRRAGWTLKALRPWCEGDVVDGVAENREVVVHLSRLDLSAFDKQVGQRDGDLDSQYSPGVLGWGCG